MPLTCREKKEELKIVMLQFRRTALSLLVWLTAVATLVGGTPRFTCRCPNGEVKPFCVGMSFGTAKANQKKSECCCNGGCCSSGIQGRNPSREPGASCCGDHHDQASGAGPGAGSQLRGACCTRTLAQGSLALVSSPKAGLAANGILCDVLVFDAPQAYLPISSNPDSFDLQEHQRPPPTNLVVMLLHLLI